MMDSAGQTVYLFGGWDGTKDLGKLPFGGWDGTKDLGKPPFGGWDGTKDLGRPPLGDRDVIEDLVFFYNFVCTGWVPDPTSLFLPTSFCMCIAPA